MEPLAFTRFLLAISWLNVMRSSLVSVMLEDSSLKGSDLLGNPTKDYKPYNWTLDLGYTYFLGKGIRCLCNRKSYL